MRPRSPGDGESSSLWLISDLGGPSANAPAVLRGCACGREGGQRDQERQRSRTGYSWTLQPHLWPDPGHQVSAYPTNREGSDARCTSWGQRLPDEAPPSPHRLPRTRPAPLYSGTTRISRFQRTSTRCRRFEPRWSTIGALLCRAAVSAGHRTGRRCAGCCSGGSQHRE